MSSEKASLVALGDGMKNKDAVKAKRHLSGTVRGLRNELKKRGSQLKNILVDINEFRASKVLKTSVKT